MEQKSNQNCAESVPPFTLIGGGLFTPNCSAADCKLLRLGCADLDLGIVFFRGFLTGGLGTWGVTIDPFVRYATVDWLELVIG